MNFYAATNRYGFSTSVGFSNTWIVMAFKSRKERDEYVAKAADISTRAITKREISTYVSGPCPFSGEAYRIAEYYDYSGKKLAQVIVSGDIGYPKVFRR